MDSPKKNRNTEKSTKDSIEFKPKGKSPKKTVKNKDKQPIKAFKW